MTATRLQQQIEFLLEIDKAKRILRRSRILDASRRENDAEHSWHLAVMAVVLREHAEGDVDLERVIRMILVHDLVEIDAGDTFLYDANGRADKNEREQAAARRIFGLLPPEQRDEFMALWEEFEARETPEAKYAAALDRLQPLLANYHTQGSTWREFGVKREQVISLCQHMEEGSPTLWTYAKGLIDDAVRRGYLASDERSADENSDKEKALQELAAGAASVAVNDGVVLGRATGRGLRPLYQLLSEVGEAIQGAYIADRVIGHAAALLIIEAKARAVYGLMVSNRAVHALEEADIEVEWDRRVPHILAQGYTQPPPGETITEGRDAPAWLCPMERLVMASPDVDTARRRLHLVLSGKQPLEQYLQGERK